MNVYSEMNDLARAVDYQKASAQAYARARIVRDDMPYSSDTARRIDFRYFMDKASALHRLSVMYRDRGF